MKTIKDTLKPEIERWDDPGDYPSGAGAGPLPSHDYVAGIEGSVSIELTCEDMDKLLRGEFEEEITDVCVVTKWRVVRWSIISAALIVDLEVEGFDPDSVDVPEPPEPDYEAF